MNGYLLDTHTWLWVQGTEANRLPADLVLEIEQSQAKGHAFVSAISVLEIARLVAYSQYDLGTSVDRFVSQATAEGGLVLLDLSIRILIDSTRLPGTIHRDPADRLLVATAREHGLTLITRDKPLLQYAKQGHLSARRV